MKINSMSETNPNKNVCSTRHNIACELLLKAAVTIMMDGDEPRQSSCKWMKKGWRNDGDLGTNLQSRQTDASSLSIIIPSSLNLDSHVAEHYISAVQLLQSLLYWTFWASGADISIQTDSSVPQDAAVGPRTYVRTDKVHISDGKTT